MLTVKVGEVRSGPKNSTFTVRRGVAMEAYFIHNGGWKYTSINKVFNQILLIAKVGEKIDAIKKTRPEEIRVFPRRVRSINGGMDRTDYYVHSADLQKWYKRAVELLKSAGHKYV